MDLSVKAFQGPVMVRGSSKENPQFYMKNSKKAPTKELLILLHLSGNISRCSWLELAYPTCDPIGQPWSFLNGFDPSRRVTEGIVTH